MEKRSKLRNLFEKNKELIIIPTYKDTSITLAEIAKKFFLDGQVKTAWSKTGEAWSKNYAKMVFGLPKQHGQNMLF